MSERNEKPMLVTVSMKLRRAQDSDLLTHSCKALLHSFRNGCQQVRAQSINIMLGCLHAHTHNTQPITKLHNNITIPKVVGNFGLLSPAQYFAPVLARAACIMGYATLRLPADPKYSVCSGLPRDQEVEYQ